MKREPGSFRASNTDAHSTGSQAPFEMVALAASAGGLAALSEVLSMLPKDFPASIAVVQHLDPRHRSLMAEILARRTPLSVKEAQHKNAVEAMPNGGTLTLRACSRQGSVVVEVVDTGVGISQNEKVFHPLVTSNPGGVGLGLNIVQRIMRALGGEIGYSSEPGQGTKFSLSLSRC